MFTVAGVLLTAIVGAYVLMPLFREPKGNLEVELLAETDLDRLLSRKAMIYSNLRELEFEYKMGRLGDADYGRLEAGYKSEAAEVLRQIDQLGAAGGLDEVIDKEVAARKARLFPEGEAAAVCPDCGAAVPAGKKFCGDCGRRL